MKQKIFVLVDVLQFYVSCERAFQSTLRQRPTIVVGNNDAVIVALSKEAEKLGLYRGQPLFQCRSILYQHQVQVLSSNFALYDFMSKRLMALLAESMPSLEIFSIDEAFGEIADLGIDDLTAWGKALQGRALRWLGLPVRISFAPTKVLAKVGAFLLKANEHNENVLDLTAWTGERLTQALEALPVEEIFGIGPRSAQYLQNYGIHTAKQFRDADERWIKKRFTVVGARIQQELRGVACFPLRTRQKPRQQIIYARTFGRAITELSELEEAVSEYTARAAVVLRSQDSLTRRLTIFVSSSRRDPYHTPYANEFTCDLRYATAFTPLLLGKAQEGARAVYREGILFTRAGVILGQIVPLPVVQLDLFGEQSLLRYYQEMRLMALMDALNRVLGRDTLRFAAQGTQQTWRQHQNHLSRRYMTRWGELLTIE